jgi:hypothetical protein
MMVLTMLVGLEPLASSTRGAPPRATLIITSFLLQLSSPAIV